MWLSNHIHFYKRVLGKHPILGYEHKCYFATSFLWHNCLPCYSLCIFQATSGSFCFNMSNIGHHPRLTQIHPPLPRPPIPGKQPQPSFGSAKRPANVGQDLKRWRETQEGSPFVSFPRSWWLPLGGSVSSWASRSAGLSLGTSTWRHPDHRDSRGPLQAVLTYGPNRSAPECLAFLPPKLQPQQPNGFQVFANLKYVISVFYFLGPLESEPPISMYPLLWQKGRKIRGNFSMPRLKKLRSRTVIANKYIYLYMCIHICTYVLYTHTYIYIYTYVCVHTHIL